MVPRGGIALQGELNRLQEELESYFGYLSEVRAGLKAKPVEKPAALGIVEMMESMKLPLVAGGLLDQPHIWLLQYNLVLSVRTMFAAVQTKAAHKEP